MSAKHTHDDNPLSHEEQGILNAFRVLGVPANASVPTDMLAERMGRLGFMGGSEPWKWESAYVSLEVRGLITPGKDPFSAIGWMLTPRGHALVNREGAAE